MTDNILLFFNLSSESLDEEMKYLENRGFRIIDSPGKIPEGRSCLAAIVGPLSRFTDREKAVVRDLTDLSIPVLFLTTHCERPLIDELDSVTHEGIVPRMAGCALLGSAVGRLSRKAAEEDITPSNILNRFMEVMSDASDSDYGQVLSSLTDAVIIDKIGGRSAIANLKAEQILGLSRKEIEEGSIYARDWEFIHEDLTPFPPDQHPHVIAREMEREVNNVVLGINRPGRNTQWISVSSIPLFDRLTGQMDGIVTHFYDVSDIVAIRKHNIRLVSIFQNAEWGIAIGNASDVLFDQLNPSYARMHGYTVSELLEKRAIEVIAPDARERYSKMMSLALKKGHNRFEVDHIRKDGTLFPAVMDIIIIKDHEGAPLYWAMNILDITEDKKQEQSLIDMLAEKEKLYEQLKKEKEYSDALFNNSPIAIYSVDKNCRIVNFNRKAEEITGYSKEDLIGKEFNFYVDDLTEAEELGKEYLIRTRDNSEKIIEKYSSLLYDDAGEIVGDIESFIDITNWKKLQEFRSDMERIIRHDLKTPLNSIIGFPKLMLTDDSLSDEYHEYLMIILLAGQNMLNLINASLNLYKLEQGTYELNIEKVDVVSELHQIRRMLKDNCSSKKCPLEIIIDGSPLKGPEKIPIQTEKSFFNMILVNLIKNALEASPRNEAIRIDIRKSDRLEIAIHNKGAIPQSIRSRFFEKNVTYGKKQGNGLGTYSAQLMARAINAELTFRTDEEEGTTLFLKL